jgi:arylsulfatase A-like enzyme
MSSKNIVLIVLDAVRADHLSCYDYQRTTTPNIDRLASEGVRYEHAFSNSNYTGAAHPPIFTGEVPSNSGLYGGKLSFDNNKTLLTELLKQSGYRTFAILTDRDTDTLRAD